MDLSGFQVDVRPAQSAQFARAQAGQGHRQEQRAQLGVLRSIDEPLDLGRRRDVTARFELALAALVPADGYICRHVRVLCGFEQRLEAGQHLPRQGPAELRQQVVAEVLDRLGCQACELDPADPRRDVKGDMLPILSDRRPLGAVRLDPLNPAFRSFGNRFTLARCRVHTLANIDLDGRVVVVGILLARERLDMAVAFLIDVVHDPCFTRWLH